LWGVRGFRVHSLLETNIDFFSKYSPNDLSNGNSVHFRRVREIAKSYYELRCFVRSVSVEQLGSYWIFMKLEKSVKKIQVSLESDKNNGYFT